MSEKRRRNKAVESDSESPAPPRVRLADRTRRCAFLGLLFWPFQLYTIWLLLKLWFAPNTGDARDQRHVRKAALVATAIAIPCIFGVMIAVLALLGFSPLGPTELDPMQLERPLVMMGVWEGKRKDPEGETTITLELRRNGECRYQATGAENRTFTGSWGFAQRELFFNIRSISPEDKPARENISLAVVRGNVGRRDGAGREPALKAALGAMP